MAVKTEIERHCSSAQRRTAAAAAYGRQSVSCKLLSPVVLHWAVFRCGRFIIKCVVLTLVFCWPEIPSLPNSALTKLALGDYRVRYHILSLGRSVLGCQYQCK